MRQASLAGKGIKPSWARLPQFALQSVSPARRSWPADFRRNRPRIAKGQSHKAHLDKFSLFANESACSRKFLPTRFVLIRSGQPKAQGTG